MRNLLFFLLLLFGYHLAHSQNESSFYSQRDVKMNYYDAAVCNTTEASSIQHFIQKELGCELVLSHYSENQYAKIYTFTQRKNEIEVYHGFSKVIVENTSHAILVMHDLFYDLPETVTSAPNACWYFHQKNWVLATRTIEWNREEETINEILTGDNRQILLRTDLALRSQLKDTTIRVKVFYPDPLTSAHKNYAAPYLDYNDSDVAVLNAQRIWKNVTCNFKNDTFWLSNKYLVPAKYNNNTSFEPVFKVLDTVFDFTRHQHEFEDMMVFYHITTFQNYINSLGYDSLGFRPTPYDAHAIQADNSMYLPGWGLAYGTGGIDDAEDAQTIVHEYSHSLREYASPSTNNGLERQAMEEGLMDYFATSYKMGIDSFGWKKFGFWDGNNAPTYSGRSVASPKIYPQALTGNVYDNSEIWSSALMRIYFKLGKTVTDKLGIQTLYYLSNNLSMSQAALLIIKSDTTLFNGIHAEVIWRTFAETHILPWYNGISTRLINNQEPIKLVNSLNFMMGKSDLFVTLPLEESGSYSITNNLQQLIASDHFSGNNFSITPNRVKSPGIYYLTVSTPTFTITKKIIMY